MKNKEWPNQSININFQTGNGILFGINFFSIYISFSPLTSTNRREQIIIFFPSHFVLSVFIMENEKKILDIFFLFVFRVIIAPTTIIISDISVQIDFTIKSIILVDCRFGCENVRIMFVRVWENRALKNENKTKQRNFRRTRTKKLFKIITFS